MELPLFMGMHQGMEGDHAFAVDIRSNDPVEPLKTVRWSFTPKNLAWKAWMDEASQKAAEAK